MGSLNGDVMVNRNGRATSQVTIYNYPEHLNPFYEDEQHKRLRFWKVMSKGKDSKDSSRRNSFSIGNLKEMWAFKSFRLKKKSSTLGIYKTSESPPPLRRDQCPINGPMNQGTWNSHNNSTLGLHDEQFQRNASYRSSLQHLPASNLHGGSPRQDSVGLRNMSDGIGFHRNDNYRSTIQVPNSLQRGARRGHRPAPPRPAPTNLSSNGRYVYAGSMTPQPSRNDNYLFAHRLLPKRSPMQNGSLSGSLNPFDSDDNESELESNCSPAPLSSSASSTPQRQTPRKKRRAPPPPSPNKSILSESSRNVNDSRSAPESSPVLPETEELCIREEADVVALSTAITNYVESSLKDEEREQKTKVKGSGGEIEEKPAEAEAATAPPTNETKSKEGAEVKDKIEGLQVNLKEEGERQSELEVTTINVRKEEEIAKKENKPIEAQLPEGRSGEKTEEKAILRTSAIEIREEKELNIALQGDQCSPLAEREKPTTSHNIPPNSPKNCRTPPPSPDIDLPVNSSLEKDNASHLESELKIEENLVPILAPAGSAQAKDTMVEEEEEVELRSSLRPPPLAAKPTQRGNSLNLTTAIVESPTLLPVVRAKPPRGIDRGSLKASPKPENEVNRKSFGSTALKSQPLPNPRTRRSSNPDTIVTNESLKVINTEPVTSSRISRNFLPGTENIPTENSRGQREERVGEEEEADNQGLPKYKDVIANDNYQMRSGDARSPTAPQIPIRMRNLKLENEEDQESFMTRNLVERSDRRDGKHTTLAPLETNIPPERRRSVKDIIESINRSQRILNEAANKQFQQPILRTDLKETNNNQNATLNQNLNSNHRLERNDNPPDRSQVEMRRMIEEIEIFEQEMLPELKQIPLSPRSPRTPTSPALEGAVGGRDTLLLNGNESESLKDSLTSVGNEIVFEKCRVTKDVYNCRESSPTAANLDWNPLPKPKRTKTID